MWYLLEALLITTHIIYFRGEVREILPDTSSYLEL